MDILFAVFFILSCMTGFISSKELTGRTDPPIPTCQENGFYPVGECSSQYYICLDGNLYPATCPPGGVFDPVSSTCVAIDTLPSCQTTLSVTVTEPSTRKPIECTVDGSFEFSQCQSAYYICISGIPYFKTCPDGSVFVETESTCKPLEETECLGTTETTTPTTTVPTTTVPEPFTCPDANTGFYPVSPGACSGDYFTCFEGIAYPEKCPDGNIFDVTIHSCTAPENAACNQWRNLSSDDDESKVEVTNF